MCASRLEGEWWTWSVVFAQSITVKRTVNNNKQLSISLTVRQNSINAQEF